MNKTYTVTTIELKKPRPELDLNAFYWPNRRAVVSFLLVVRPLNGVGVHRVAKAQVCVCVGGGGGTRGHTHHTPLS